RPRSRQDRIAMGLALVAVCIPVFFLGLGSLYVFWFKLHLVPGTGYVSPARGVLPWLHQMVLPWTVLALLFAAVYARMGRATLVVSFAVVVMNLLIDLAYAFLDPRIRYS